MNTSQAANSNDFFNSLVTGTSLEQYTSSVFEAAACTGCMYEFYKAAYVVDTPQTANTRIFLIAKIRGDSITSALGQHLENDCGDTDGVEWANVQDQQIPSSLQVQQNTNTASGAEKGLGLNWRKLVAVCTAVTVVAM